MANYVLKGIGTAEVEKKKVRCSFKISSGEFFRKFAQFEPLLSSNSKSAIEKSIDTQKDEKIKNSDEIEEFFSKIQSKLEEDVGSKPAAAPAYKEEEKKPSYATESTSSTSSARESPKSASTGDEGEGQKLPVKVVEKIVAHYEYNSLSDEDKHEGEAPVEEEAEEGKKKKKKKKGEEEGQYGILTRTGELIIANVSSDQKVWDITGKAVHNGAIEKIDEQIVVKSLAPNEESKIEYQLKAEKEPSIKLSEFISTINDPNTLTYSLNVDQDNIVYFKSTLKNTENYIIKNIVMKKDLFQGYSDVQVLKSTPGDTRTEDGKIIWEIPELDAGASAELEFTITVKLENKEQKVRSGKVEVSYDADSSLSDLKLEDFEAYSDNEVSILDEQLDDDPDKYIGSLRFKNLSSYVSQLKSISVKEEGKEDELIQVPEGDVIYVSANSEWMSNEWTIDTQGDIPVYRKQANFILAHELTSMNSTSIEIDDIELAVALFEAGISYEQIDKEGKVTDQPVTAIASFREVPFNATNTLSNGGAAPFDYISIRHKLPTKFKPPKKEEIKMEIDGKEYPLDPDWITISDGEPSEIFIEMDNLREKDMGQLMPNQKLIVTYPIIASNLSKDETFITDAEWTANTFPRGEPIVISEKGEEAIKIEVLHQRIKAMRGKTITATSDPKVYEVELSVLNNSDFDITDYILRDRVPNNFDAIDIEIEPAEHSDLDGKEVLVWKVEKIVAGEEFKLKYKMKASNDKASASEAQFSM